MESGALSDTGFPEFAKDVVLFLHNTSASPREAALEDEPYPRLLQEKGFRGFPSLAFLDAGGEVIAAVHWTKRSVDGFRQTLRAVKDYLALKDKAGAGDEKVQKALFLTELALGKLDLAAARQGLARTKNLTNEEMAHVQRKLVDLEVEDLMGRMRELGREGVGKRIAELIAEDRLPSGEQSRTFWSLAISHAEQHKDAELFARALDELEKEFGDDERYERVLERWRKTLQELRGR